MQARLLCLEPGVGCHPTLQGSGLMKEGVPPPKLSTQVRGFEDAGPSPGSDLAQRALCALLVVPSTHVRCGHLQDIVEFIFFPVVNEGCRVIDEGEGGALS